MTRSASAEGDGPADGPPPGGPYPASRPTRFGLVTTCCAMRGSAIFCLHALLIAAVSADTFIAASSPLVLWNGRPAFLPSGAVAFDWEGTGASLSVASASPGATLTLTTNLTISAQSMGRVSVFINDYEAQNLLLHSGTSSYLLAVLPAGTSNISVQYAIEPLFNADFPAQQYAQFVGFSVGNGGVFVQPTPLARRIDIAGDSISAGSMYDKLEAVNGDMSLGTGCAPWSPLYGYSQQFNWETYLCRYFRANCTTIAWSGGTLLSPEHCPGRKSMSSKYPFTWATDSQQVAPWDFSRTQQPDAVIIYLCVALTGSMALPHGATAHWPSSLTLPPPTLCRRAQ